MRDSCSARTHVPDEQSYWKASPTLLEAFCLAVPAPHSIFVIGCNAQIDATYSQQYSAASFEEASTDAPFTLTCTRNLQKQCIVFTRHGSHRSTRACSPRAPRLRSVRVRACTLDIAEKSTASRNAFLNGVTSRMLFFGLGLVTTFS